MKDRTAVVVDLQVVAQVSDDGDPGALIGQVSAHAFGLKKSMEGVLSVNVIGAREASIQVQQPPAPAPGPPHPAARRRRKKG